ncbi:amino acid transporter [Sporobolomyces salmoneus]|uniref:amino acid transporter n=1 Tax=Sporobolomyces salmoneus TaxID=183962 RepID=UPI00317C8E4B
MPPKSKPINTPNRPSSSGSNRVETPEARVGSPIPQIPGRSSPGGATPTFGSPRQTTQYLSASPSGGQRPRNSTSPSPYDTPSSGPPPSDSPQLTEAQKAEVIRRHLLSVDEQKRVAQEQQSLSSGISLGSSSPRSTSAQIPQQQQATTDSENDSTFPTPYHLEGGDVVAGVYKWAAQQAAEGGGNGSNESGVGLRRSKSFGSAIESSSRRQSHAAAGPGGDASRAAFRAGLEGGGEGDVEELTEAGEFSTSEMLQPGGFRRDFVYRKAMQERENNSQFDGDSLGVAPDASDISFAGSMADSSRRPPARVATRSFIDFLSLYGHFGGEDLEEIDEEDEEEDEEADIDGIPSIPSYHGQPPSKLSREPSQRGTNERTPLIRGRSSRRDARPTPSRKRSSSVGQHGDATVLQAVMMLLKSFVGTGVLFLGKAFFNGGILFSTIVLCFIAMISLYSFLLLVKTRLVVHGSFGDIGGMLYGKYMRWAILFSIVLSQIGFVAAYTIFVSQNLQAFFMAVSNCRTYISIPYLILAQLVVFLPLAMIRNIQKLSGTALVADAFILFGLVYIFSNEIGVLVDHGIAKVELFNSKDFPLLIGTAVFSFEGIGLVIPITESMKDPHKFPKVLSGVMVGIMFLFAGAGVLSYLAYGKDIQTVVFVNLPQEDKFVNAAQFLYSLAILLSTPLQLFPAVRIMENGIFSRSGKHSNKVKWEKNGFRTAVVIGCAGIAWAGASDLDKFVSLIGSLACVPLCFCYPALLHYKACAHTRKQKILDIALLVFGIAAAVYTTSQTVTLLLDGGDSAPPTFGKCPPRQ